jgi:hypothetical protein
MNKLLSSKFQAPGPGALVGEAGDLTLTSRESSCKSRGVDAQEPLAGFEPNKAFFHTWLVSIAPHPVLPGT